jgi:origin recognition complex subunit 4
MRFQLAERAVAALPSNPIVIRLSGWVQHNDRLAMREIARQLTNQTGTSFLTRSDSDDEDEQNPFLDIDSNISLPPPSHLPSLISVLPTLSRPTIVILDGFDLFALHARQSLLYCLLDTVQSCRAGQGNRGLAVIGVTSRIDSINLLEKRVKSRFSGRMFRTACPTRLESWTGIVQRVLLSRIDHGPHDEEWERMWSEAVEEFLEDQKVVSILNDTFSLTKDVRTLCRVLVSYIRPLLAARL